MIFLAIWDLLDFVQIHIQSEINPNFECHQLKPMQTDSRPDINPRWLSKYRPPQVRRHQLQTTNPGTNPRTTMFEGDFDDNSDLLESPDFETSEVGWKQVNDKSTYQRERRSLLFKNLPSGTDLKDVVSLLRGGTILDIYVGSKESQAFVSFVNASVARTYLGWVKRERLSLRGQNVSYAIYAKIILIVHKISVEYAEKSFWTPKSVATRIEQGATRNLLIRGLDLDIDEDRLRADLDHIHNLAVVEIYPPKDGNGMVVSLNAIHLALFARTCLRSQIMYKKAQISFYPDKCTESQIPNPHKGFKPLGDKTNVRKLAKFDCLPRNRFQLLKISDEEDNETADEGIELESSASENA